MPLQGTFDVLDFTDVVQLLARQQLTGRLHVRSRSYGANLFLEDGLLVGADQSEHQPAATAGDVRGRIEEVCFEMLEAERGSFEFHPGKPSSLPVGERHQPESVITEARRRLEEWHELQEIIPSLDLQPRLVLDLSQAEVTLDKQRWRMLTAIDGRRNLRAIGRVLNLSDFDVCRLMRSLVDDGVVELEGFSALSASTRDVMPVVPTPDTGGMVVSFDAETTVVARPDARPDRAPAGADLAGLATPPGGTPAVEEDPHVTQVAPTVEPPPDENEGGEDGPDARRRRVIRIRSREADAPRS